MNVCSAVEPVAASVTTIVWTDPGVMLGTEMFWRVAVCPVFVRRIVFACPAGTVRYVVAPFRRTPTTLGVPSGVAGFLIVAAGTERGDTGERDYGGMQPIAEIVAANS